MTTVFREPDTREPAEVPGKDNSGITQNPEDIRPVEDEQDLLEALGVEDDIKVLPEEDYKDFQELKGYLESYLEEKGLPKSFRGYQKGIKNLKEDTGLDEEADPQAVIKKIGGIAKSWKALSFVRDFEERKKILSRLLRASTRDEMDEIVMQEMERKKIWLR